MIKAEKVRSVESSSGIPRFQAIASVIREEILNSKYTPGEHLPTNREFVKILNSSQATVTKAMNLLLEEGLILRKPKVGTVVAPIEHRISRIKPHQVFVIGILDIERVDNPLNWFISEQFMKGILNYNSRHIIKLAATFEESRKLISTEQPNAFLFLYFSPQQLETLPGVMDSPFITCSTRAVDFSPVNGVNYDAVKSCFDAVSYMIRQGHKDIGMIWGGMNYHQDSIAGYKAALNAFGIEPSEKIIMNTGGGGEAEGYAAMEQLAKSGNKFTAVFADTDLKAIGALAYCRKHGIKVPEKISIMGCDNIPVMASENQLTTVHKPFLEMGQTMVKMLDKRLSLNNQDLTSKLFIGKIKERKTCAPPS